MTPSHGTRITTALACTAALALALPGSALAKPRTHRAAHHSVVTRAANIPEPTIIVPHKYDAGGDGGELTTPAGVKLNLFDPLAVAVALGNQALGQLGLPPIQLPI
jgi:hypothetical protein